MSLLNEAKMPSLKDKVDAVEEARLEAERKAKAEAEKPKKKRVSKKKDD